MTEYGKAVIRLAAFQANVRADAEARYEGHLIAEARAIADGRVGAQPTAEHLRVLFKRLDAAT